VFADGAGATLSLDAVDRLHLAVGHVVDDRVAAEIAREETILAAYDRALNMLALRGRSAQELRRRLIQKGEERIIVDLALERLEQAGFLDDASFARQFARSKALNSGLSKRRLSQELAKRGVTGAKSREAIEEVFEEERIDESSRLEAVARKKLRSLAKLEPQVQRRRLFAFLARRGYEADDIRPVIDALCTEGQAETDA